MDSKGSPSLQDSSKQIKNLAAPYISGTTMSRGAGPMSNMPAGGAFTKPPSFAKRSGTSTDTELGANATIVHAVMQRITESNAVTKAETGVGQVILVREDTKTGRLKPLSNQRAMQAECIGLSQFNYQMRLPHNRKLYGSQRDSALLRSHYAVLGVQNQDVKTYDKRTTPVVNHAVGKRCRMFNLVDATGYRVGEGDRVYLQWHRYAWEPKTGLVPIPDDGKVAEPEYFWQLLMVATPGFAPLPQQFQSIDYVGHSEFLGTVHGVYFNGIKSTNTLIENASAALFPTTRDEKYKENLIKCDEIEMQLRV